MAPYVPNPRSTSAMMSVVLIIDWLTSITLLRCIFSMPVKAAVAVLTKALVKTVNEAI